YAGSNGEMSVQLSKSAEYVGAYLVDPDFFHVFSMPLLAGRPFAADDAGRVAVVSAGFAQRRFGSAAAALGQTVAIDGVTYSIIGVAPALFDFPKQTQVWAAISPVPENRSRSAYNYRSVAKLRAGVTLPAANAQLQAMASRLAAAFPDDNRQKSFTVTSLQDQLSATVRSTMFILMGAVGLVLLIACANVANLMLARATARSRELAVRAALGAGRSELISQLLAESTVLAAVAGLFGIGLAAWGTKALLGIGAQF